jgi:hypothetical protein
MSVLPSKADIRQRWWRVRYVPQADISGPVPIQWIEVNDACQNPAVIVDAVVACRICRLQSFLAQFLLRRRPGRENSWLASQGISIDCRHSAGVASA